MGFHCSSRFPFRSGIPGIVLWDKVPEEKLKGSVVPAKDRKRIAIQFSTCVGVAATIV